MRNLFAITGRMNCALSLVGPKHQFYPKILSICKYEEDLLSMYLFIMELRLDAMLYSITRVTKILMRAIPNVRAGRRFITPVLKQTYNCLFNESDTRFTSCCADHELLYVKENFPLRFTFGVTTFLSTSTLIIFISL